MGKNLSHYLEKWRNESERLSVQNQKNQSYQHKIKNYKFKSTYQKIISKK